MNEKLIQPATPPIKGVRREVKMLIILPPRKTNTQFKNFKVPLLHLKYLERGYRLELHLQIQNKLQR